MTSAVQSVLSFWFGELDALGLSASDVQKRWWVSSVTFDQDIKTRFGKLNREILAGEHLDWLNDATSTVAYILVLDQFSRNLYRGDAAAFSGDKRALTAAELLFNAPKSLPAAYRFFAYMPYMHSESLQHHDRLQQRIADEVAQAENDQVRQHWIGMKGSANSHRALVVAYGRYPHRNAVLNRISTPEEQDYLADNPARYGQ